jgi:hypothetical protein
MFGDSLIITSSGPVNQKDIPVVVKECQVRQNCKLGLVMVIVVLCCVLFLTALQNQNVPALKVDEEKITVISTEQPTDLVMSFRKHNKKFAGKLISARYIRVQSTIDDLIVNYIFPHADTAVEPTLRVVQGPGLGSLYEIKLDKEYKISKVSVTGSQDPKEFAKLSTAKIMIKNNLGENVWQSPSFLEPAYSNHVELV